MQVLTDAGAIKVSEEALREVLAAVDKAKAETEFTTDPMPDGDMDIAYYNKERAKRGTFVITSPCSKIRFEVRANTGNCESESMGWRCD